MDCPQCGKNVAFLTRRAVEIVAVDGNILSPLPKIQQQVFEHTGCGFQGFEVILTWSKGEFLTRVESKRPV